MHWSIALGVVFVVFADFMLFYTLATMAFFW